MLIEWDEIVIFKVDNFNGFSHFKNLQGLLRYHMFFLTLVSLFSQIVS